MSLFDRITPGLQESFVSPFRRRDVATDWTSVSEGAQTPEEYFMQGLNPFEKEDSDPAGTFKEKQEIDDAAARKLNHSAESGFEGPASQSKISSSKVIAKSGVTHSQDAVEKEHAKEAEIARRMARARADIKGRGITNSQSREF